MIKQDYSLDRVLQRARIASKTGELSPEVRDQLEQLVWDFKSANDKLEAYQAKQEASAAQQSVDRMAKEAQRAGQKDRKEQRLALDDEFGDMVKKFDSLIMGRMSSNPMFDPEAIGLLGKMARNRVESGITRIEDIVDYVHEQLTNLGHEISKRDIRDAISGYGKTAEMSKDQIDVALREAAKRQGKLISALEDAQAAVLPLKSGLQRDKATERVQELTKQVKQAMREYGIDVRPTKTPEEQWKSALETVKTRLRNQISDLTKQLQTGEKEAKGHKGMYRSTKRVKPSSTSATI